jgi:hypothetical protein
MSARNGTSTATQSDKYSEAPRRNSLSGQTVLDYAVITTAFSVSMVGALAFMRLTLSASYGRLSEIVQAFI